MIDNDFGGIPEEFYDQRKSTITRFIRGLHLPSTNNLCE